MTALSNRRMAAACLALGLALVGAPRAARAVELGIAYYGETITHPGVKLGVGLPIAEGGWHLAYGAFNLGAFHHERNSDSVFANAELGYQLTFPIGLLVDVAIGAGYLHTFAAGPVYAVEGGAVRRVANLGQPLFMPSVSLGLGWRFVNGPGGGPLEVTVKPFFFTEYPRDHLLIGTVGLEVGLAWTLPARAGATR